MGWASGLSWLAAWATATTNKRPDGVDGADMGTAFGLDASFGPVGSPASPEAEAPASSLPWVHRLTRRSGL